MATTFVDTAAFYAFLDRSDRFHERALRTMEDILGQDRLITHSYVLLETAALIQRRLGTDAVRVLQNDLADVTTTVWVDAELHAEAALAVTASRRTDVSLVDRVSFSLMRRVGADRAFTFDRHFADEGFELVG